MVGTFFQVIPKVLLIWGIMEVLDSFNFEGECVGRAYATAAILPVPALTVYNEKWEICLRPHSPVPGSVYVYTSWPSVEKMGGINANHSDNFAQLNYENDPTGGRITAPLQCTR